jgi:type IV pilus assembly protein PilA
MGGIEMLKKLNNKKGFTIIEIMVVIAIIGILAAVLVPQFAGVKDKAKASGVLTNARVVEAYVTSIIEDYSASEASSLADQINSYFSSNKLDNPYEKNTTSNVLASVAADADSEYITAPGEGDAAGIIYAVVNNNGGLKIYINGFDEDGKEIKNSKMEVIK